MSVKTLYQHPPKPDRCCASVSNGHRSMSWHQCYRKAIITREGAGYCKVHDPHAVRVRRDATHAEFQAKWDRQREREEHWFAASQLLRDFTAKEIRSGEVIVTRRQA